MRMLTTTLEALDDIPFYFNFSFKYDFLHNE
jgi:hypothetical protein